MLATALSVGDAGTSQVAEGVSEDVVPCAAADDHADDRAGEDVVAVEANLALRVADARFGDDAGTEADPGGRLP